MVFSWQENFLLHNRKSKKLHTFTFISRFSSIFPCISNLIYWFFLENIPSVNLYQQRKYPTGIFHFHIRIYNCICIRDNMWGELSSIVYWHLLLKWHHLVKRYLEYDFFLCILHQVFMSYGAVIKIWGKNLSFGDMIFYSDFIHKSLLIVSKCVCNFDDC